MCFYRKYGFNHYMLDSEVIDIVYVKTEIFPRSVSPTTNAYAPPTSLLIVSQLFTD